MGDVTLGFVGPVVVRVIMIPAVRYAFCIVGLCFVYGIVHFTRPVWIWLSRQRKRILGVNVAWPLNWLGKKGLTIEQRVQSSVSHWIASIMASPARALHAIAVQLSGMALAVGALSEATYNALNTLRHTTVPKLIEAAVKPVRTQAQSAITRVGAVENTLARVGVGIRTRLATLPWAVPASFEGAALGLTNVVVALYRDVNTVLEPAVRNLTQTVVPAIRLDVATLTSRLDNLIASGVGALAGRVTQLETAVFEQLQPQLAAALASIDTLAGMVTGQVSESLTGLYQRVATLEAQLADFIGTTTATLAERLTQLEAEVRQDIRVRVEQLELAVGTIAAEIFEEVGAGLQALTGRILDIESQIGNIILPRLAQLEALLTPAALAVAVMAALRIAAPNLFCRNVTDVSSRICAQDEGLWAELLAGTLVFAIALNPREVAQAGAALVGFADSVIHATANHIPGQSLPPWSAR